jgi:hypothetical protein
MGEATRATVSGALLLNWRLLLTSSYMNARQATCASPVTWPLMSDGVRLLWLRSCCAVAEGADVPQPHTMLDVSLHCSPGMCVAAVLGDALRRVAVLGGREGMPRSLGSVYGGSVTRFLGGGCRGVVSRVIDVPIVMPWNSGVAVSRDGSTLLVSDDEGGSHAIHAVSVADGSPLRVVGSFGDGPLQFKNPHQVWVAPDDFVFVADYGNHRVQVLTPTLDFRAFVGVGELFGPSGVCADDDIIMVSEVIAYRVTVFGRRDGALLRRFGSYGRGDGELYTPLGLCFTHNDRHVAVADYTNNRVSVFSVEGEFVRHVGAGELRSPTSVACSAFDELVVADSGNDRVVVLSASGELVKTMGDDSFAGVAVHGGTIFAQTYRFSSKCVVFE